MKILLISLMFISSLYSQYAIIPYSQYESNVCVLTKEDFQDYGSYYFLTNVAGYGVMIMYKSSIKEIKDGYDINPKTGKCELISEINKDNTDNKDKFLGMKEEDFNFAMAIYGVALSSLIGFGLVRSVA